MKLKVLTTSDTIDHDGWRRLKSSLDKFGYDYEHIKHPFSFGHQLPVIRNWCENYKGDCTHILYTDAFDTLAFGNAEEVISKYWKENVYVAGLQHQMWISGEKACYPHPERAKEYPESNSPWKYVNGGGWLVEIYFFTELCKKENLNADSHDQVWLMEAYLKNQDWIKIDTECEIFQTIAFSHQHEWTKGYDRFQNVGTQSFPVFFHGNGRTDMSWLYE